MWTGGGLASLPRRLGPHRPSRASRCRGRRAGWGNRRLAVTAVLLARRSSRMPAARPPRPQRRRLPRLPVPALPAVRRRRGPAIDGLDHDVEAARKEGLARVAVHERDVCRVGPARTDGRVEVDVAGDVAAGGRRGRPAELHRQPGEAVVREDRLGLPRRHQHRRRVAVRKVDRAARLGAPVRGDMELQAGVARPFGGGEIEIEAEVVRVGKRAALGARDARPRQQRPRHQGERRAAGEDRGGRADLGMGTSWGTMPHRRRATSLHQAPKPRQARRTGAP
jgi:hypothetical protein